MKVIVGKVFIFESIPIRCWQLAEEVPNEDLRVRFRPHEDLLSAE
jgi:hypothetical protein